MRNLLFLLLRYHAQILFLFFEILSIVIIINYNSFQKTAFFQLTQTVRGAAFNAVDGVFAYVDLAEINDSLAAENAKLRERLEQFDANKVNDLTVVPKIGSQVFNFIPVKIIGNSTIYRNNYITINKGTDALVESDMGLLNDKGILGIIKAASFKYASGISILHTDFAVSAKISELDEVGSVSWDGKDYKKVQLLHIPRHVKVLKGQKVIVSQYSALFPEATPIGVITGFSIAEGGAFYEIEVELYNDMRNIEYAYVAKNTAKKERDQLEKQVVD